MLARRLSNLQQVFLYLNDACNLRCRQCIYKPAVTGRAQAEIAPRTAVGLLSAFHRLGARKVTFLGGEPTLYGADRLRHLIGEAKSIGYSYVRLDTNGQFGEGFLRSGALDQVDELAFSIDGYDAVSSEALRGPNTFERTLARVGQAKGRGIGSSITCCIHGDLVRPDVLPSGVERVIQLAEDLGVDTVNFHDLFKTGVPMDSWTGDYSPRVADYVSMYDRVRARVAAGDFRVKVRLPQCFVTTAEFASNPDYYGFCPVKLGERVMLHANGAVRICSNMICSSYDIGHFADGWVRWNAKATNEARDHDLDHPTPCTNRGRDRSYGEYVPLCFSFKPHQDEYSWCSLRWDARRGPSASGE